MEVHLCLLPVGLRDFLAFFLVERYTWRGLGSFERSALDTCDVSYVGARNCGATLLLDLPQDTSAHHHILGHFKNSKRLFFSGPVLLLALVQPTADRLLLAAVRNPATTHLTPLLFIWAILLSFCWALGEALRPIPFFPRFLLLGVLWAFWHFTNYTANRPLKVVAITLAISYPAIILVTFLIGVAVERSRSLWVAVAILAWIDLSIHLWTKRTFIVFAVSILFWIFLLWRWPQPSKEEKQAAVSSEVSD
jgi:hypothetical protein